MTCFFICLQLQVQKQSLLPQPSYDGSVSQGEDEIDSALTDLQVSLEGTSLSAASDITRTPELRDYLRFFKCVTCLIALFMNKFCPTGPFILMRIKYWSGRSVLIRALPYQADPSLMLKKTGGKKLWGGNTGNLIPTAFLNDQPLGMMWLLWYYVCRICIFRLIHHFQIIRLKKASETGKDCLFLQCTV